METLWWLLTYILWLAWSVIWWLIVQLFWLALWVLLPVIVVAFVALRLAEHLLGQEVVRAWVKKHSLKYGADAWHRARRALFALGVVPLRVLGWFVLYSLWHTLISLWWRPRWSPWQRAWSRRRVSRPARRRG